MRKKILRLKKSKWFTYVLLLLAVFAGVFILLGKKKTSSIVSSLTGQKKLDMPIDQDKFTMTNDELDFIGQKLFTAMDRVGTDEQTIFEVFEELNTDEINYLFDQFGTVKYGLGARSAIFGQPRNLGGWLKKELTKKEYEKLRNLLKGKGVNVL